MSLRTCSLQPWLAAVLLLPPATLPATTAAPQFTVSKIFTSRGGVHSTTRGTIRLVCAHDGRWLVFHGGPNMYHFSPDGIHWTGSPIEEFGSRSHLVRGDTVYSFVDAQTDPDPRTRRNRPAMFTGRIRGDRIAWGPPQENDLSLGYYVDLQQDSTGRFTASGRVVQFDQNGKPSGITIEWARTLQPGDPARWGPQQRVFQQISDMQTSEVHENLPLEDGQSYVIGMLGVAGQAHLYGNHFDGRAWGTNHALLATNMSNVRGTDKRPSAVWDPREQVIHLTYVDHQSRLWYRTARSPYRAQDWSEAVRLVPFKVFAAVLSIDRSKTPAELWVLYGQTLFEHRDPRWQSGALYLMKSDGRSWSEPVLASEPGTTDNWYPNLNEDASQGLGVLYLKGMPSSQAAIKDLDFDLMFSSPGPPRQARHPVTSLANPAVRFTVPDKPYVVLKHGQLEAAVVDNRAVDDAVLPGHRAGYSGLGSLKHSKQPRNLFVPAYAGVNFEHIHDGTLQPREILFEPRHAPMELRLVDERTAELHQAPTPHWGLESCHRYQLLDDDLIELTFECIPRRDTYRNGYIGLFWASYIDQPESRDIHFLAVTDPPSAEPVLVRGVTPQHGVLATHLAQEDRRHFPHDPGFPLTLVFNHSRHRFAEPWYAGVCRGLAFIPMFRPPDQVRLTQSPSGGGKGNPAWDFQWFIPNYRLGERYQLVARFRYTPLGATQPGDDQFKAWLRAATGPRLQF